MNASDEPELNKALEDSMKEKAEKEDHAAKKKLEPIKETVHSDKLYELMAESNKRKEPEPEPKPKPNEKSPEQLAAEKKLLDDEKK